MQQGGQNDAPKVSQYCNIQALQDEANMSPTPPRSAQYHPKIIPRSPTIAPQPHDRPKVATPSPKIYPRSTKRSPEVASRSHIAPRSFMIASSSSHSPKHVPLGLGLKIYPGTGPFSRRVDGLGGGAWGQGAPLQVLVVQSWPHANFGFL